VAKRQPTKRTSRGATRPGLTVAELIDLLCKGDPTAQVIVQIDGEEYRITGMLQSRTLFGDKR
jgi:hypothetical protein